MAPAEEIDICDRCGKTANDFKSKMVFKLYLKENNGHLSDHLVAVIVASLFKVK